MSPSSPHSGCMVIKNNRAGLEFFPVGLKVRTVPQINDYTEILCRLLASTKQPHLV